MSTTINGVTYHGNNVSIINGVVTIDGVVQTGEKLSGVVKVEIVGTLGELKTDASVEMTGDVEGNVDAGGSVNCNHVGKDVDAGGSITCGNVGGDVDAGGSVRCGSVNGNIDAGGSVKNYG